MWVYDTHSMTEFNVLDNEVAKKCSFTGARLADAIHMLTAIGRKKPKGLKSAPLTFPTNGGHDLSRVDFPVKERSMARKYFTKEFKNEACKLVMDRSQEIASTARDLGVGEQTLRYWLVKQGWQGPRKEGITEELER